MSIKLIELINSVESLNYLSELKLPAKTSFVIGKFLKDVTPEIETYNKIRSERVKEYGTVMLDEEGKEVTDDSGNVRYSFKDKGSNELNENGKKFIEEMNEVEEKELDIKIPEINISDLSFNTIEPKYLIKLYWLIKE